MDRLPSAFRQRLLERHRELGDYQPERKLTPEILEDYETLVNHRCELCQMQPHADPADFAWPYPRLRKKAKQPPAVSPEVTALHDASPAEPDEALALLDHTIKRMQSRYMPYFYTVHDEWCAAQQKSLLREARHARKSYAASLIFNSARWWERTFLFLAVLIFAWLLAGLMFSHPPSSSADKTMGRAFHEAVLLDASEARLLHLWKKTGLSRDETALEAMAHLHRERLIGIGRKLIQQARALNNQQRWAEAQRRLTEAIELSSKLSRVLGEPVLQDEIADVQNAGP